MENKNNKLAIILTSLFQLTSIVTAISSLVAGNRKRLLLSFLAMFCLSIPFIITYIANKKEILLPPKFQLVSSIFIFFTQYLGEILGLYEKFPWWDLMLHGVSGACFSIVALYLTENIILMNEKVSFNRFLIFKAIWALSFTALIGVLWEMFEYVGDYLFKTNMVEGELDDTATDIIIKVAVAFITLVIYYLKNRKKSHV